MGPLKSDYLIPHHSHSLFLDQINEDHIAMLPCWPNDMWVQNGHGSVLFLLSHPYFVAPLHSTQTYPTSLPIVIDSQLLDWLVSPIASLPHHQSCTQARLTLDSFFYQIQGFEFKINH